MVRTVRCFLPGKGETYTMKDFKDQFRKIGIVPVVVLDDAKDAAPLAQALTEGGLPCAEVQWRPAPSSSSAPVSTPRS